MTPWISMEKHFERLAERVKIEVHSVTKAEVQTLKTELKEIFRAELKITETLVNGATKTLDERINSVNLR
jgi:hypothetical protein